MRVMIYIFTLKLVLCVNTVEVWVWVFSSNTSHV